MNIDNKDAVITIQGGGIFGLSLLGQLQAVLEKHDYKPMALAGSSAGAIVATLLWSGLSPREIRKKFVEMVSQDRNALLNLLGPFEPPPKPHFDFQNFTSLKDEIMSLIPALAGGGHWLNPKTWIDQVGTISTARRLKNLVAPHATRLGFFRGLRLEELIDQLLRLAPDIPKTLKERKEPLRFRDFRDLASKGREASYRPPLFLTATNLTKRRLEVISSIDEEYMAVPVAKAVRASAGYPVFFRPTEIPECDAGWFVDGGVVSNFPTWVFSEAFRVKMQTMPLFRQLSSKPWIRIGLRVVDDPIPQVDLADPAAFFTALVSMFTGRARNQLEDILSSRAGRSIVIQQPTAETNGPRDLLEINELTSEKIDSMVLRGYEYADELLTKRGSPGIYTDTAESAVVEQLGSLAARCNLLFAKNEDDLKLRANVFLPIKDRLKLIFSHNMEGDPDKSIEFANLDTGLVGFCYIRRRPQVCNLAEVAKLRGLSEYQNLFGMPPELQARVKTDRTWLASVPIFDPYERRFDPATDEPPDPEHKGKAYHPLETAQDGAVVGVLALDSAWDYAKLGLDPDPDIHFKDERIRSILALMESAARTIAEAIVLPFTAT